jgi:NMD protein affecting ribosome stability and mRNA decay
MTPRPTPHADAHKHVAVTTHVLRQREGVPYEVERQVCADCRRVLDERLLRRAAA